ncbi:MAG: hypothetical protein WBA66_00380 [Xanthobacteraceae bacterium]
MSSDFTPQWPRTVAGADWRAPLYRPELEAIAKRADHLYRTYSLSEEHRAWMLVQYGRLVEADKLIDALSRIMGEISLRNDPGVRPSKPMKHGIGSNSETINGAVGFAPRLADWVQKLEDHYGVTAWREFGHVGHDVRFPDDPRNVSVPVDPRNFVPLVNPHAKPVLVDDDIDAI